MTDGNRNKHRGPIVRVHRESDASWRHGTRETQVFHRKADDTYWQAQFRLSTDGDTNELAEGLATITRVYPHQVTVVAYRPEPAR